MKKALLLLSLVIFQVSAHAQVAGDTPDRRLFLLCKTWGYVKYFHQNKCAYQWDEILNNAINQVLQARTNDEFNAAMMNMLNGVGNNSVLVDPGTRPDTNLLVDTNWIPDPRLSQPVKSFLSTFTSRIIPDQSYCLARQNSGHTDVYGWIDFTPDIVSIPIDYAVESNRLTVMFYYWNVINYFFPYRELMDQPWDQVLIDLIPLFRQPQTEAEFHINFLKLTSSINDTHGSTFSRVLYDSFWGGTYRPKIRFERIENQCVVKKFDNIEGVERGDILTAIDGKSITEIEDSMELYIGSSNRAAFFRDVYDLMLRGVQDSEVRLTLSNRRGQPYTTMTTRDLSTPDWISFKFDSDWTGSYRITESGCGYVNMYRLMPAEVPAMYDALQSTPAIIFDMRNYPNGTLVSLAPFFFGSRTTSATVYLPALTIGQYTGDLYFFAGWYNKGTDLGYYGAWNNPDPYSGKVIILVNQETQSQAEMTCQYLSYHPDATVMGTQTAGAAGIVSWLRLPGGIDTYFTSLGWYYKDGYQPQRNGVRIDSVVAPTIDGIRDGRDEILLAALSRISGIHPQAIKNFNVAVYPNPAAGSVNVSLTLEHQSGIRISLIDLAGRTVQETIFSCQAGEQSVTLDLLNTTPGLYFLKAQNDRETKVTKLIIR